MYACSKRNVAHVGRVGTVPYQASKSATRLQWARTTPTINGNLIQEKVSIVAWSYTLLGRRGMEDAIGVEVFWRTFVVITW